MGTGGREPGRIGVGGVREAGGERAGSGIPKMGGTRRKEEKFHNIAQYYFYNRNRTKRREPLWKGAGSGR